MKKTQITLATVFVIFSILAVLMGKVYETGQNRPPLRYALTDATKKFIKQLNDSSQNRGYVIDIEGPTEWTNDNDFGNLDNWSKIEDENFIVFFHNDNQNLWEKRAKIILRQANNNIDPLTELMGRYFYAEDMNNRKLPIYLANSARDYNHTISKILGYSRNTAGSIGLTITHISNYGCRCLGIVLHSSVFESDEHNGYKSVLLHEMNHYVFQSSLDYSKDVSFLNWEIEGIADYCAHSYIQYETPVDPQRISYIKENCRLYNDFPTENNAQYWGGESYFKSLRERKGEEFVKKFLQASFRNTTEKAFAELNMTFDTEHQQWINYLTGNLQTKSDTLSTNPPQ